MIIVIPGQVLPWPKKIFRVKDFRGLNTVKKPLIYHRITKKNFNEWEKVILAYTLKAINAYGYKPTVFPRPDALLYGSAIYMHQSPKTRRFGIETNFHISKPDFDNLDYAIWNTFGPKRRSDPLKKKMVTRPGLVYDDDSQICCRLMGFKMWSRKLKGIHIPSLEAMYDTGELNPDERFEGIIINIAKITATADEVMQATYRNWDELTGLS